MFQNTFHGLDNLSQPWEVKCRVPTLPLTFSLSSRDDLLGTQRVPRKATHIPTLPRHTFPNQTQGKEHAKVQWGHVTFSLTTSVVLFN